MTTNRVKSQYWDFVYNNETDETSESLKMMLTQWEVIVDAAYQHEVAPTTGMKHLQGWIKLDKRQYKSYLIRSRLNEGVWQDKLSFRPARNPKALMDYVRKIQDGAHGYWCKSLTERNREIEEANKKADELQREAIEWELKYKKQHELEDMTLEEYLDWNEGYEDNVSHSDPLIETATKELQQEVEETKKEVDSEVNNQDCVGDGQAITHMGVLTDPNCHGMLDERCNIRLAESPMAHQITSLDRYHPFECPCRQCHYNGRDDEG